MKLTKLVMARVDEKVFARIRAEVHQRRTRGECVHDADILREALIKRYEQKDKQPTPAE